MYIIQVLLHAMEKFLRNIGHLLKKHQMSRLDRVNLSKNLQSRF